MSLADCWTSPRLRTLTSAVALVAIIILTPVVPRTVSGRTVSMRTEDGVTIAGTFYDAAASGASRHPPAHVDEIARGLGRGRQPAFGRGPPCAHDRFSRSRRFVCRPAPAAGGDPDLTRLVLDVRAARTFLVARRDLVIASAIGIAGASLGANVAILAAAGDAAVRSLALLSPGLDYRSLRTDGALRKYGGRPALLLAGTNDPYALRSAKELAAGGGGVREIRILENAGHGTTMLKGDHDLGRVLVDWFQRTLL